uniref:hypothetical protein n=1 Tax=Methylophilus sp. TaxID=29541 RepID=UPI00403642F1
MNQAFGVVTKQDVQTSGISQLLLSINPANTVPKPFAATSLCENLNSLVAIDYAILYDWTPKKSRLTCKSKAASDFKEHPYQG